MTSNRLEQEIRAGKLEHIEMSQNRDVLRQKLEYVIQNSERNEKKRKISRTVFSMGLTVGFALGIGLVWMLQSAKEPPTPTAVATNLGTMWCTYSDNSEGGNSIVWPPESTEGQNNFVKSAPGYGEKGYAVRFKGKAGEQTKEGFIGVSSLLGPPCAEPGCNGVNITQYQKVRFKMKGHVSGGNLVLQISNNDDNETRTAPIHLKSATNGAFEAQITDYVSNDWQTVTLDLRTDFEFSNDDDLSKVKINDVLADAKSIKWHVKNGKGANVDVWIDDLEFF